MIGPNERTMHGRVLLWLLVGLGLAVIAVLLTPNRAYHDHRLCEEAVGIGGLRAINAAQAVFQQKDSEGDGTLDYGSLAELSHARLIDPVLGTGTKQGFVFSLTCSEFTWSAQANPQDPEASGFRYFYMDQTGVVRFTHALPATAASPELDPRPASGSRTRER